MLYSIKSKSSAPNLHSLCKKHPIQTRREGLRGQPCNPPPASQGDPIRGLPGWPEGGRQYSHTWLVRSETNRETETVRLGDATAHSSLYQSHHRSLLPSSSLEIEEAASSGCCGAESLISFLWLWKSSSRERETQLKRAAVIASLTVGRTPTDRSCSMDWNFCVIDPPPPPILSYPSSLEKETKSHRKRR